MAKLTQFYAAVAQHGWSAEVIEDQEITVSLGTTARREASSAELEARFNAAEHRFVTYSFGRATRWINVPGTKIVATFTDSDDRPHGVELQIVGGVVRASFGRQYYNAETRSHDVQYPKLRKDPHYSTRRSNEVTLKQAVEYVERWSAAGEARRSERQLDHDVERAEFQLDEARKRLQVTEAKLDAWLRSAAEIVDALKAKRMYEHGLASVMPSQLRGDIANVEARENELADLMLKRDTVTA